MKDNYILTDKEKFALTLHPNAEIPNEGKLRQVDHEAIIERAKASRLNEEIDELMEQQNKNKEQIEQAQKDLKYDLDKAEICAIYSRILVKPLAKNPFQKIEMTKSGLIINDTALNLHREVNPNTGRVEEQDQFIIVGVVQDAGPECRYLKPDDVIYYRKDTALPVPFFGSGLQTISENQVIAVVNEGLSERFNKK